jgi:hypothetical protein
MAMNNSGYVSGNSIAFKRRLRNSHEDTLKG